jgi:nitrite reductase (NADH) small subunit
MPNFIRLTTQSELPAADTAKDFPCGDKTICIANVNGAHSAMDNVCLHQGGPLGEGTIENGKVVCPWHGWAYVRKAARPRIMPKPKWPSILSRSKTATC